MSLRLLAFSTCCLFSLILSGCSSVPSVAERQQRTDTLAQQQGWQRSVLDGGKFQLTSYAPKLQPTNSVLTIYLEGDGLAWISRSQVSLNPTPINPVALKLAMAQPTGNAVYLARPCQYLTSDNAHCSQRYWTDARFSAEIIEATSQAIDQLKLRSGASQLRLVGYSGGGVIASLLAAQREDVAWLITVASPIDHTAWTKQKNLSPLSASLNPADYRAALQQVAQWHLAGEKDQIVPPQLAADFIAGLPQPHQARSQIQAGFTHACCWVEQWSNLWPQLSQ